MIDSEVSVIDLIPSVEWGFDERGNTVKVESKGNFSCPPQK